MGLVGQMNSRRGLETKGGHLSMEHVTLRINVKPWDVTGPCTEDPFTQYM